MWNAKCGHCVFINTEKYKKCGGENELFIAYGPEDVERYERFINKGDEILITELEHHSNYVPWHFIREKKGAVIKFAKCNDRGEVEIDEIKKFAPSQLEIAASGSNGEPEVIIKHCYIERRMIPLNIYLQEAFDVLQVNRDDPRARAQLNQAVVEYGNAIKDLVAANIFPGDMLWKNFGITRHGKVVFYDYDEIEYITDCNFRRVPEPRNEEEEMSGEVWYTVGPKDVFPETFGPFLLGNPMVRQEFLRHHQDLLDATFWQEHQSRIRAGHVHDVFPYEASSRLVDHAAAP